jgi:hypothetical protein
MNKYSISREPQIEFNPQLAIFAFGVLWYDLDK